MDGILKNPSALVSTDREEPVPTSVTVTFAPEITPPEGSVTVPTNSPRPCACKVDEAANTHRVANKNSVLFMKPPKRLPIRWNGRTDTCSRSYHAVALTPCKTFFKSDGPRIAVYLYMKKLLTNYGLIEVLAIGDASEGVRVGQAVMVSTPGMNSPATVQNVVARKKKKRRR